MENNRLVRLWINSSMRDFHVTVAIISVVALVVGRLSETPWLFAFSDITAFCGILHFFVHGYFHRQQRFLSNYMRIYALPKKKIASVGMWFITAFLMVACIGMAVVREFYKGTLIDKFKAMFLYLLSSVLSAFFGSDGLGTSEGILQNNDTLLGAMNQTAPSNESAWENIINSIQSVLILLGVLLLIATSIAVLVNTFYRLLRKRGIGRKRSIEREVKDREECIYNNPVKRTKMIDFTPTGKVRRIYRRCINRQCRKSQIIQKWMTPKEIESTVSLPEENRYQQLHEIYEKARYSELGAKEEEVRQIKSLGL